MNSIPQDDTPQKQCTGPCQRMLPATSDFFHKDRNRLYACCKECRNKAYALYCETHPEEVRMQRHRYYENHQEEVLAYHRQLYWNDLENQHARSRRYREKNPEKIRTTGQHYREKNPEKELARQRRYYQAYPEKGIARAQKHIAHKKALEGALTAAQIQAKLKAQKYACYYAACGHARFKKRANGTYIYHLEHTIPVSRSELVPRHDINYVVLACPTCNRSKGKKLPSEWPEGGRLF